MTKHIFIIFITLGLSWPSLALTKSEALAQSKSRIDGLKNRFAHLFYNCFVFEADCQIKGNSQVATLKWLSDEYGKFDPTIEYAAGLDQFMIDGAVRVAKTGHSWGAPVIFNEDLLVVEIENENFRALSFYEILGIMIHEFGHHQEQMLNSAGLPLLTHEQLDEVAVKTISYLQDRTKTIHVGADDVPGLSEENSLDILYIEIEWYNGIRNIWSNIFIDSRLETKEISESLVEGLGCPQEYTDGRLTFIGKPRYFSIRQTHLPTLTLKDNFLRYDQRFDDASVFCVDDHMGVYNVFSGYKDGLLVLNFQLNEQGQLTFSRGDVSATTPSDEHGY